MSPSKIVQTTKAAIEEKIAAARTLIAQGQSDLDRLERERKWADGEARRMRLTAQCEAAREHAESNSVDDVMRAATELRDAKRKFDETVKQHNDRLGTIRAAIAQDKPANISPPSPIDGFTAIRGADVQFGLGTVTTIKPIDGIRMFDSVIAAAADDRVEIKRPKVISQSSPKPTNRYWLNDESGSMVVTDEHYKPLHCREISRGDYLSRQWGVSIHRLPQEIQDQMSDLEKARLAERILVEKRAEEEAAAHPQVREVSELTARLHRNARLAAEAAQ